MSNKTPDAIPDATQQLLRAIPGDGNASEDCNKAVPKSNSTYTHAIEKGHFLTTLFTEGQMKCQQAKAIAIEVKKKCVSEIEDAKGAVVDHEEKLAGASHTHRQEHPLTGQSTVMEWTDASDNAKAEIKLCEMISRNADMVVGKANDALHEVEALTDRAQTLEDIAPLQAELEVLIRKTRIVKQDAEALWKQWEDSSTSHDCGIPPQVEHAASMCKHGNTKHSVKCNLVCSKGFDGPGTQNLLRCIKQGKLGKQLYGEWMGMATCAGTVCGKPVQIPNGVAVNQEIRYPDAATYTCLDGFFTPSGERTFTVACGATGFFKQQEDSQVCKAIKCGTAPALHCTSPAPGTFHYTDVATYKCLSGFSIDEMPGGLQIFSTSCQATGKFSHGVGCKPVRCGPPPYYENTIVDPKSLSRRDDDHDYAHESEMNFGDTVSFKCSPGHSLNQDPRGTDHFTLVCSADGEFAQPGTQGDKALPKCRPVSAGIPPPQLHGRFSRREMFFGDLVVVTADIGYSTTGSPSDGLTFVLHVTTDGRIGGLKGLVPVVCGKPLALSNAKVKFGKDKASYGDFLNYECSRGYSVDATPTPASAHFTIRCEADGAFSEVPGIGKCVNIDDCIGHTCGPHGTCNDRHNNYTCICDTGYAVQRDPNSDELHCGNVDDCGPEACGVGKCIELVNDYKCNCPEGYEQVEELNGNQNDKTCAPVLCGSPPEIAQAATKPLLAQHQKVFYRKSVTYQCRDGYTADGTVSGTNQFSIRCQANKQFTIAPNCELVKCDHTPSVTNAEPSASSATFDESIHFNCMKGHSIDSTFGSDQGFSVTCQRTGQFTEPQECKPVSCGEPRDIANSFRPSNQVVYQASVGYECLNGFTIDGQKDGKTQFAVTCEENGEFSKALQCLPKVCGRPLPMNVMYASTKDEGNVRYPMSTEVMCRDGYTVGGAPNGNTTFVVKCLASGDFEPYDVNRCNPVRCGLPPTMSNATFKKLESNVPTNDTASILSFGDRAIYECDVGFTTGGEIDAPTEFSAECMSSGHISAPSDDMQCRNVNDCEGHTCGPKGMCVDLVGPRPAYTCQCEDGYEIQTVPSTGEKHCGNRDDCNGHDCGVGICNDLIGDYTCQCPSGYYIGLKDGSKTCIPAKCSDDTPSLDNGRLLTKHRGPVLFPTSLIYECDTGYSVDGHVSKTKSRFQAQCKADSQLHGMMGCIRVRCGAPHVLPFTKLVAPASLDHSISYKEKALYECQEGYTIKGQAGGKTTFEVSCQADGHLTDPEICEPVGCGEAPNIPESRPALSGLVSYGQQVKYQCNMGYTLNGKPDGKHDFTLKCLKTGKFSAKDASTPCRAIYTRPASIENAHLIQYASKQIERLPQIVTYPNSLQYECVVGYSLNGSPYAATRIWTRVTSEGALSPALPRACERITYLISGFVKDARNGNPLAGATVSIEGSNIKTTSESGYFTIGPVAAGSLKLVFDKSDYIQSTKQVQVTGDVAVGGVADVSISPKMSTDQWRVLLKWGLASQDLDSYAKWGSNKVCWTNLQQSSRHVSAHLEHDDVTDGQETLHLSGVGSCKGGAYYCDIRYYVHDFTKTGKMLDEMADVTLYTGNRMAGSWQIQDCPQTVSEDRNWWHVFTLDGATNMLKWTCLDGLSPPPLRLDLIQKAHANSKHLRTNNRTRDVPEQNLPSNQAM